MDKFSPDDEAENIIQNRQQRLRDLPSEKILEAVARSVAAELTHVRCEMKAIRLAVERMADSDRPSGA